MQKKKAAAEALGLSVNRASKLRKRKKRADGKQPQPPLVDQAREVIEQFTALVADNATHGDFGEAIAAAVKRSLENQTSLPTTADTDMDVLRIVKDGQEQYGTTHTPEGPQPEALRMITPRLMHPSFMQMLISSLTIIGRSPRETLKPKESGTIKLSKSGPLT